MFLSLQKSTLHICEFFLASDNLKKYKYQNTHTSIPHTIYFNLFQKKQVACIHLTNWLLAFRILRCNNITLDKICVYTKFILNFINFVLKLLLSAQQEHGKSYIFNASKNSHTEFSLLFKPLELNHLPLNDLIIIYNNY